MIKLFKSATPGLKVLFVSTEAAPFAKIGGLGSVMQALPNALRTIGCDARVMIPRYLSIDGAEHKIVMEKEGLKVPTDNEGEPSFLICNVKKYVPPAGEATLATPVYFLENQEYYEKRANVYDYADDPVRWALLCRGALEFVRQNRNWVPDVIVATDWMIGFLPNYLRTTYKNDPVLSKIASVFSIHNLGFHGMFDHHFVQEMDFDDGHSAIPGFNNPRLLKMNGMRRGIMYANVINTVSPTYAREIMTKDYGENLEDLLKERRGVLFGILNGLDYKEYNPETDLTIKYNFNVDSLNKRSKNKEALQSQFGLKVDSGAFVIGVVGRLAAQKGLDLLQPILQVLLNEIPIQFVVVGEGETGLMHYFKDLEESNPGRVAAHLKFDAVLPRMIFAGADVVIVPSRFEPSGLVQMEAMRYGAIPIVRKTGGLADTVEDYNPAKQTGTGFIFDKFDSFSLMISVIRAFENYRIKNNWAALQKRAMQKDFSWESSANEYVALFERAIELRSRV